MKVSFIGHSAILVETKGVTILSDPWWQGPCFGVQWWVYPDPWLAPIETGKLDFIYISHAHQDHLHNGTLSRLPKTAKILVAEPLGLREQVDWQRHARWVEDGAARPIASFCNTGCAVVG